MKILVIDDKKRYREIFIRGIGDIIDAPDKFIDAENLLRTKKYDMIFLDHRLNSEYYEGSGNGDWVFREIRNGNYGELNKNTDIFSISSVGVTYSSEGPEKNHSYNVIMWFFQRDYILEYLINQEQKLREKIYGWSKSREEYLRKELKIPLLK